MKMYLVWEWLMEGPWKIHHGVYSTRELAVEAALRQWKAEGTVRGATPVELEEFVLDWTKGFGEKKHGEDLDDILSDIDDEKTPFEISEFELDS